MAYIYEVFIGVYLLDWFCNGYNLLFIINWFLLHDVRNLSIPLTIRCIRLRLVSQNTPPNKLF